MVEVRRCLYQDFLPVASVRMALYNVTTTARLSVCCRTALQNEVWVYLSTGTSMQSHHDLSKSAGGTSIGGVAVVEGL
jgi:hypothetical protein